MNTLFQRFLFFMIALAILPILPDKFYRYLYLGGVSSFWIYSYFTSWNYKDLRCKEVFNILLAFIHLILHQIWPFLTDDGYDIHQKPFWDVLFHFMMLFYCYYTILGELKKNNAEKGKEWFKYVSYFFLLGSLLNAVFSVNNGETKESWEHHLFTWSSVFQAFSTGYWIFTMVLWRGFHSKWFTSIYWLCVFSLFMNWFIYKMNEPFIALSMRYCYIEGLFIIASWMPLLKPYF